MKPNLIKIFTTSEAVTAALIKQGFVGSNRNAAASNKEDASNYNFEQVLPHQRLLISHKHIS